MSETREASSCKEGQHPISQEASARAALSVGVLRRILKVLTVDRRRYSLLVPDGGKLIISKYGVRAIWDKRATYPR